VSDTGLNILKFVLEAVSADAMTAPREAAVMSAIPAVNPASLFIVVANTSN
jgi:hypothetical protein